METAELDRTNRKKNTLAGGMKRATSRLPEMRVKIAILLSFFPCALLYPFEYPAREIITLVAWMLAFPSLLSFGALSLLFVWRSNDSSYFAFNLFCVAAPVGVALCALKYSRITPIAWTKIHRFARACTLSFLFIALWQILQSGLWMRMFPELQGLDEHRGAGFRTEPSYLASPLGLYLSTVVYRLRTAVDSQRRKLLIESVIVIAVALMVSRSLSVLIVVLCFAPALVLRLRFAIISATATMALGSAIFYERIGSAIADPSGSWLDLLTTGVGSWRNIPDILIIANYRNYLFPANPTTTRELINDLATAWNPEYAWLENTFSTFSACASTIGIIGTICIFILGIVIAARTIPTQRNLRVTWGLMYVATWFFFPKFEACGWMALVILALPSISLAKAAAPVNVLCKRSS